MPEFMTGAVALHRERMTRINQDSGTAMILRRLVEAGHGFERPEQQLQAVGDDRLEDVDSLECVDVQGFACVGGHNNGLLVRRSPSHHVSVLSRRKATNRSISSWS